MKNIKVLEHNSIITTRLKKRFCKDMNIPIKLFKEPYFSERLKLYDKQYKALEKYHLFLKTLEDFKDEQSYLSAYNKLKDDAIDYLNSRDEMTFFKRDEDMNKYQIKNKGITKKDIFKESHNGHIFISIDMVKANFTAIKHYDKSIVGEKETYEEFIGMFTKYEYFKKSKYIRQVIFGNQNPKRQTTYEKYLMDKVLEEILYFVEKQKIVFFGNDEIVIDVSTLNKDEKNLLMKETIPHIISRQKNKGIQLRQENFELRKIPGTKGYVKKFLNSDKYEFKCLDNLIIPFVLRAYQGEEIHPTDSIFLYENKEAKLLEAPQIKVV